MREMQIKATSDAFWIHCKIKKKFVELFWTIEDIKNTVINLNPLSQVVYFYNMKNLNID